MSLKSYFFAGLLLAALGSCKQENLTYDKPYFDFDSLVSAQIAQLSAARVSVWKKTAMNTRADTVTIHPDAAQWKHELAPFQQLDVINRPLYKGTYRVEDVDDVHSNLKVRTYMATTPSPVRFVKIYYHGQATQIRKIEATFEENNLMFATSRSLLMEFEDRPTGLLLMRYQAAGRQKMILSAPVDFSMAGDVRLSR